ncbi:MAG: hypothetical protein OXC62_10320 [Aestuariivita sp.]|nr:hypothetical protein [Aestuariivita sp.]
MIDSIIFDPLLPWSVLIIASVIAASGIFFAALKGLTGWALRALAAFAILGALLGPIYQEESRIQLPDIVLLIEDRSASQYIGDRSAQTTQAIEEISLEIEARSNTELRRIVVTDGTDNSGTRLMTTISEALAEAPSNQIAGIITVTDGRIHDAEYTPKLPAPLHVLLSGQNNDWDRRIIVKNAPAFGIIGEPVMLTVRVENNGLVPEDKETTEMSIAVDGREAVTSTVPFDTDIEVPITLSHGGRNVIQFAIPQANRELTDRNNAALIQINGVRDRLRVLLVSGEPHQGGRAWRNLLKSDSSVDLVHFTILRPPDKQDGVPVNELSLIAFPTHELFIEKIKDFDLIIFDRYKRRGILPAVYLDNVAEYVRNGGAVLVIAGPDFASADSLYRSPLSTIFPAEPSARIFQERFRPSITEIGERHPVTSNLKNSQNWGAWLRQVEINPLTGNTLMTGVMGKPLLILDRVENGRVALIASDHAWLWSRGYDNGGPQLELLRRLAHWMMKEPELEEEALWAETTGQSMKIKRRTLEENTGMLKLTQPNGEEINLQLEAISPGNYQVNYDAPTIGLYRLSEGDQQAVVGLGPSAPKEFEKTIRDGSLLRNAVELTQGGLLNIEDGLPMIRSVREGRPASGRGWIGITPRGAYKTTEINQFPLLPAWLMLILASAFILMAWIKEGRN